MNKAISLPIILVNLLFFNTLSFGQAPTDTVAKTLRLNEISVTGVRSLKGLGHLTEEGNCIIYAGKKTEVLLLDSIDANTAQNNPRQLLGRLPGAVFSETAGSGFPSNGIGFRGVNPVQSIETNTRQNGYNISADLFGYNEAYFLPPLEAVERIEVIRGAASLQFGPQFGGAINYLIKQGNPDRPFEFSTEQTAASYGFFNSFNSIGGTYKGFSYYSYFDFSTSQGWRPNSDYRQYNGYIHLQYKISEKVKLGAEYTSMQNRIHMAGGMDDAEFAADPRASYRTRNWLTTPWNIVALTLDAKISDRVSFSWKNAYSHSARNLVWRNEDLPAGAPDTISALTRQYDTREVEREKFDNITSEARMSVHYDIGQTKNTFAGGVRFYYSNMVRLEDGTGTTGSDFNLSIDSMGWGKNLLFTTTNFAPFFENIFRITDRFSITPGFRLEYIHSTVAGYSSDNGIQLPVSGAKNRVIPLAGIGLQYRTNLSTQIYANISQAYRPVDYASLTPFGTSAEIDPNMKDAYGFNSDIGFRGTIRNYVLFDVNAFALLYNNTIGIEHVSDDHGHTFDLRTNVANSLHTGAETYIEIFPVKMITHSNRYGQFSFYNSFSYVHAQYISGSYKGKWDENAPQFIERLGATYATRNFSATFNASYTSSCYTDAANTVFNQGDPSIGMIPSYMVMDFSASYKFLTRYHIKAGVNNLADHHYFTLRTNEYPGPGIIPSMGRSFYVSIGARF